MAKVIPKFNYKVGEVWTIITPSFMSEVRILDIHRFHIVVKNILPFKKDSYEIHYSNVIDAWKTR